MKRIIEDYIKFGWTTVAEVGSSLSELLHTHTIMKAIGLVDYCLFPRIDNDFVVFSLVRLFDIMSLANYLRLLILKQKVHGFYLTVPGLVEALSMGQEIKTLEEAGEIVDKVMLDPYEKDHLMVVIKL
mgnify:CR=1 FL=1